MSEALDNDLLKEAMARIGRGPDGRVFYLFLQKVLMGIPSTQARGALRENHGRRMLASEIRGLMSEAVREADPSINERPVVFAPAQPVAGTRARGARRRIAEPGASPGRRTSSTRSPGVGE